MKTSVTSLEPPQKSSLETWSFSDAPIRRKEDDRLNRLPFAKQIAALIHTNQSDTQVIGLYGEWGEGKTSVLNLTINEYQNLVQITEEEKPIIVRFSPWEFASQTNLTKALFSTIAQTIEVNNVLSTADKQAIVKGFVAISHIASEYFSYIYPESRIAIKAAHWTLDRLVKLFQKIPSLEHEKENLRKHLSNISCRIIVLIDDIDRLLHPEIRELIRVVKANGDLPNLTWILSCDRAVVARAIAKDLDETDEIVGHRFLDKIIPIGLDLPKVPRAVLFDEFLRLLQNTQNQDLTNASNDLRSDPMESVREFCDSMRNVKRLANAILVSVRMFHAYQGDKSIPSIHFGDFINLESWRRFEPRFCNALYQNKDLLMSAGKKIKQKQIEEMITSCASENRRKTAIDFIMNRFGFQPYPGMPNEQDQRFLMRGGDKPDTRYRLANSMYFDSYFSFLLDDVDISRSDEERILQSVADSSMMIQVLLELDKKGKLPSLLFAFEKAPVFKTDQESLNYLESLWSVAEEIDSDDEFWHTRPFDFSRQTRIMRCSLYFLQEQFKDSESKLRAFQTIMEKNTQIISQPLYLLALDLSGRAEGEPSLLALQPSHAEEIKNKCLERISQLHAAGVLSKHHNSFNLRINWRQLAGNEAFSKATTQDFQRLPDAYANLVPFTTTYESNGLFHTINLDALEEWFNAQNILQFLKANPSPMMQFQELQQCLEFAIDAKSKGKRYDGEAQKRMIYELRNRKKSGL